MNADSTKPLPSQPQSGQECLRTWVEVDASALHHNLASIRQTVGPAPEILAVVKANAYGHGARLIAESIAPSIDYFGVACIDEANEIRHCGKPVFLLSPCLHSEFPDAVRHGYIVTISSVREAEELARHGRSLVNFKIDTGMGRAGCPEKEAVSEVEALCRLDSIRIHSISSHLPVSDEDAGYTSDQLARIEALREQIEPVCPGAKWHVLNSAGIFHHSASAMEIVRAGLSIYGAAYPDSFQSELLPVLTWKARILTSKWLERGDSVSYGRTFLASRPTRVATVSVGYADGFQRQASGSGVEVIAGGRRRKVLGRVTMDQIVIDITEDPEPRHGEEVVLIGRQGAESIAVRELAARSDTIAWHVFTSLAGRVRRVLVNPPTASANSNCLR